MPTRRFASPSVRLTSLALGDPTCGQPHHPLGDREDFPARCGPRAGRRRRSSRRPRAPGWGGPRTCDLRWRSRRRRGGPTIIRIEVDLAPFGPRKPSPGLPATKLMSSTTVFLPYFDNESIVIMGERPLSSMPARSGSCRDSLRSSACLDARKVAPRRVVVRSFPCPTTRRRTPPPPVGDPRRPVTFGRQIQADPSLPVARYSGRPVTFYTPEDTATGIRMRWGRPEVMCHRRRRPEVTGRRDLGDQK